MRLQRRWMRWVLAVTLLGCGEAQLSNTEAGVAAEAAAASVCQTLGPDEALIGVSPEGEAWVEGDAGVRLIGPNGVSTPVDASFTRADALVAWDAASAFVVGDNSLWSTTMSGAEPLSLPPELGKPRFVCGDPRRSSGAFVITTRGLFERLDEVWLRWSFPVEHLESLRIADLQGACSGRDPVMYLEAGDALWEVRYGDFASLREVADLTNVRAGGPDPRIGFVALRDGEIVRFDGAGWVTVPFDEGDVTELSVADGVLWAAVGRHLYRRNRFDEWEHLQGAGSVARIDGIAGYAAGGAWLVQSNELCHVQPRETLWVRGVRPHGRLDEGSSLSVEVSSDPLMGTSLSAALDGQSVPVTGAPGDWRVGGANPLSPGWHALSLSVATPLGAVKRTVAFLVEGGDQGGGTPPPPPGEPTVTWEADIRPLYERSCSMCHGEDGNQTFLGSFDTFSALGELALERVSTGEMPPPTATSVEPLSEAEIELLETWVQEGMNP